MDTTSPAGKFPTTHWSLIARGGSPAVDGARAALAELCGAYWYPIYALVRRRGYSPDRALDLTQDYFVRLIEKGTVAAANPAKGRFRSFLLADCSFFLADSGDHDRAWKRGSSRRILSIDARDAEGRYAHEPGHNLTPERQYERDWAHALIARVFARIEGHYAETGRGELFHRLKPLISCDQDASGYDAIARDLGMSSGALRVAAHRMRGRFALWLREEIAATLEDPGEAAIDDELRDLFAVLGPSG